MPRRPAWIRGRPLWALGFLALLLGPAHAVASEPGPPSKRPNIVVILADDLGYADLGAQSSLPEVRTPHLDELARDGVRFENGYASAPQCVPSRAGLLTGRYQQRFGLEENRSGPLPAEELTLAERLSKAGYRTGQVGKWQLAGDGGEDEDEEEDGGGLG